MFHLKHWFYRDLQALRINVGSEFYIGLGTDRPLFKFTDLCLPELVILPFMAIGGLAVRRRRWFTWSQGENSRSDICRAAFFMRISNSNRKNERLSFREPFQDQFARGNDRN
jgi:hypothetical protein